MKNSKWTVAGLAALAMVAIVIKLQGQTLTTDTSADATSAQAEPLVLNTADMATVQTLSDTELAALISALDATPQIAYDALPNNTVGTFYSLQNPEWPPLPGDVNGLPVWQMNGFYLLNDVSFDYSAAAMSMSSSMMMMDSIDPGSGDGGTNPSFANELMSSQLDTNALWLEVTNVDIYGGIAYANLHNATNMVYAIWATTNLLGGWQVENEVWPSDTNCEPFTMQTHGRDILFLRAEDFTDVDANSNSIPDWWEWKYFGYFGVDPNADPDKDGVSNLLEYQTGGNPLVFESVVYAWGDNREGECNVPVDLTNAIAVTGNDVGGGTTNAYSLALKADGTVVAWGDDYYGQTNIPAGLNSVVMISAGGCHGLALRADGTVASWGKWKYFNPVTYDYTFYNTVVPDNVSNVVALAAGLDHDLAVRSDGSVVAWGADTNALWVVVPTNLPPVKAVTAGWYYSAALLTNGSIVVWSALGNNPYTPYSWTIPADLTNVAAISGAPLDLVAVRQDGTAIDIGMFNSPIEATGASNLVAVADGYAPVLGLKSDRTATILFDSIVSPDFPLDNILAVGAGWAHALVVRGGLMPPIIKTQPVSQIVPQGTNVTFAVQTTWIAGMDYQWQFEGVDLPGATNAVLVLPNVQPADSGVYACRVSNKLGAVTSSNATLTVVAPPVITAQSQPTNIVCIYGNYLSLSVTVDGFLLSYQWQINGTNISGATSNAYSLFVTDGSNGTFSVVVSNAAGTASASWQVTVTNAINVTNDLLLVYNTNSADSIFVKDYYLAHRPNVGGANVLGIGFSGFYITNFPGNENWVGVTNVTDYESISPDAFTNLVLNPVLNWLAANPAKRPQYIILMLDVPSRISFTATNASNFPFYAVPSFPSVSYQLANSVANWRPYITHLNMNGTNDCVGYINKLAGLGTLISSNSPILSASTGEYGNTNYAVDNIRDSGYANVDAVSTTTNGLLVAGVSLQAISYVTGIEGSSPPAHLTGLANLAGYICWGTHSSLGNNYAIDGSVQWQGNSGWWLIRTEESFNGQRYVKPYGNYIKWFSNNAFGGAGYSNTPIGAVCYGDEPGAYATDNSKYFGLWASGKNFAICAWSSISINLSYAKAWQMVGDPFVVR